MGRGGGGGLHKPKVYKIEKVLGVRVGQDLDAACIGQAAEPIAV